MAMMPKGAPKSASDGVDDDEHAAMLAGQRTRNQTTELPNGGSGEKPYWKTHPGLGESLIPVWGSAREAAADFSEGDYLGGSANAALAASDLFLAGSLAKGAAKGGFYIAKNAAKKAPYAWKSEVRPWLTEQKFLAKGQAGHHWLIPQNGWGKQAPDWLKNQPWNIKGMPDAVTHGRIHGPYKGAPQFNIAEQYWHGTPAWAKVAPLDAAGHPATAAYDASHHDDLPKGVQKPPVKPKPPPAPPRR